MKLSNREIVKNDKLLRDFPPVAVEQTNYRISDIIRRNLAGEQVSGTTKIAFDFLGDEKNVNAKVNPFSRMGFDLDDLIVEAAKVGKTISDLQDEKGRIDKELAEQILNFKKAKESDVAVQNEIRKEAQQPATD